MAKPKETIWSAEPHTIAKHQILRKYLGAWFSILGQSPVEKRMAFIDGFCGPGEYKQSDGTRLDGSPIIALRELLAVLEKDHPKMRGKRFLFLFVDDDAKRVDHLKTVAIPRLDPLPDNIEIHCEHSTFDHTMTDLLDSIEENRKLIPALVMIDPFGWSGLPMELIGRILANEKTEVFITFMVDSVNRFLAVEDVAHHFQELIGCDASELGGILDAGDRFSALSSLYERQLRAHARHVRSFRMLNSKNRPIYDLVFGSNHHLGLDQMKKAMWAVDPVAGGSFSDRTSGQTVLFADKADTTPLRQSLLKEFGGRTVSPRQIEDFVLDTAFHSGQIKRLTLAPMQRDGLIDYVPSGREKRRQRPGEYGAGSKIRFVS